MAVPVRMNWRADDFRKPVDFVNAVVEAVNRVPMVRGRPLPVEVLVPPETFRRAMLSRWDDCDGRTVMYVAIDAATRANPRAQIVDAESVGDAERLAAWGEELIGALSYGDSRRVDVNSVRRLGQEDAVVALINDGQRGERSGRRLAELLGLDYAVLAERVAKTKPVGSEQAAGDEAPLVVVFRTDGGGEHRVVMTPDAGAVLETRIGTDALGHGTWLLSCAHYDREKLAPVAMSALCALGRALLVEDS